MPDQHPLFTFADELFYDSPANWQHGQPPYEPGTRAVPPGWERRDRDVWVVLYPTGHPAIGQGWKVHVSARPANAERVLAAVADYCLDRGIPFKFLRDPAMLWVYNSKYFPRPTSGKFAAIYPPDERALRTLLEELGEVLDGERGPYVLSDLRWRAGPLYVRYGGFSERFCLNDDGELVLAVQRPDGTLVPDLRRPVFRCPDWVTLPDFLAPLAAARGGSGGSAPMPYTIERPLHFSNGGGLYLARQRETGGQVVLKEARPYAALDRDGRDALARLEHERAVLDRLAGVPGVPAVLDWFSVWEHRFLTLEFLPGDIVWKWVGRSHPLVDPEHGNTDLRDYATRALALVERVQRLVERIHERGVVIGDLHPGNLIVGPDDSVSLVDYEAAGSVDDDSFNPPLGTPGFAAWKHGKVGVAVDEHALAALRLWMFLPLNAVWSLDPSKVDENIDEVERRFELPAGYCRALRTELRPPRPSARPDVDLGAEDPDLDGALRSIAGGVLASATPDRTDRLFPGDIEQFAYDGACFAYGAAGVLWALSVAGAGRHPEHERWLLDAAGRSPRPQPSFGTGLSGLAYVLDHLGHHATAGDLLERAVGLTDAVRQPSLFRGLAGIGLTLLHFAARTGTDRYVELARDLARPLLADLRGGAAGRLPAGLLHGWSGVALFWLRLFEADGDEAWLDAAVEALHRDLDRCVLGSDGSLQVEEVGVRTLAYLDGGSSGIAMVAEQVLRHRPDMRLEACLHPIRLACAPEYVAEPQLFSGRAGLLASLCRLTRCGADTTEEAAIRRHVRRFTWHALAYKGHLAFPGDRCLRLSMDLATGSAGVLLALATTRRRDTAFLPFLDPAAGAGPADERSGRAAGELGQLCPLSRPTRPGDPETAADATPEGR